jgi:hypothetical protein
MPFASRILTRLQSFLIERDNHRWAEASFAVAPTKALRSDKGTGVLNAKFLRMYGSRFRQLRVHKAP